MLNKLMNLLNDKKEIAHIKDVLIRAQKALEENNSTILQNLSDQISHSASIYQHTDLITAMTIIYALNKMILRKDKTESKSWANFVKKFNSEIDKAILELDKEDIDEFTRHLQHAKELMISMSPKTMSDIKDIIKKSCINKAGKIYEHGISLSRTAQLFDITSWELSEYVGENKKINESMLETYDIKKRAQIALSFFE